MSVIVTTNYGLEVVYCYDPEHLTSVINFYEELVVSGGIKGFTYSL